MVKLLTKSRYLVLIQMLLRIWSMGLNNDDYVEIMKTIAYHNYETDIEGVEIEYEEDSII